jgi:hypothetical protein
MPAFVGISATFRLAAIRALLGCRNRDLGAGSFAAFLVTNPTPSFFRLLCEAGRPYHSADRRRCPTIRSNNQQRVWRLYSRYRK